MSTKGKFLGGYLKNRDVKMKILHTEGRKVTINSASIRIYQSDENGKIILGSCAVAVPTNFNSQADFAKGARIIRTDVATGISAIYENVGTSASSVFKLLGGYYQTTSDKTVPTTGAMDWYVIAPSTGVLSEVDFSGKDALAAHDTNYLTFSITNLGQAGSGNTAMLAASDANTTKVTGGSAIAANTKRSLTVHGTTANLAVVVGDRLKISVTNAATAANTVTFASFMLRYLGVA